MLLKRLKRQLYDMHKIYLVHLSTSTINRRQTVHVVPTHSTPEMTYLSILNLKIQNFKKLQNWKLESADIMPHGKFINQTS